MARSKEQIDQLKSLVDQLRSEGLSTDEIQAKVDEQKAVFDAEQTNVVEVTDEIQTNPTEGKTNDTVETGAPAVSETGQAPETQGTPEITGFKPVDTSLGSRFIDSGIELEGFQFADGIGLASVQLPEVVVTADQYKNVEQQIQNEGAKNVTEQQKAKQQLLEEQIAELPKAEPGDTPFAKLVNYLSKKGKEEVEETEDITAAQSVYGSTVNSLVQLSGVDDRADYLLAALIQQVPDDVFLNILGEDAGRKAIKSTQENFSRVNKQIDNLNSLNLPTLGFTDIGQKEGFDKVTTGLAATFNGLTAFGTSAVTSLSTGGAGLASDMLSMSIKDFNDTKAESLGITTEQLFASGQGEILTPSAIGGVAYSLERFGIKGVTKYINRMGNKASKGLFAFLNTGNKEGATEWAQSGLEEFNKAVASGMSTDEAAEKAWSYMVSSDGLENYLQGFAGGSGSGVLGRAAKNIRNKNENEALSESINRLNELENSKYRKNLSAEDLSVINTAQDEIRFNLRDIVNKSNELVGTLTDKQIADLNANTDFITSSTDRINEIQNSEAYTDQEKQVLIDAVNEQREAASQNIFNIRNEADKLQEQIETVKGISGLVKGLKVEEADTAADAEKFAEDNNLDIKSSTSQGYILQNPETGEQTIVINKETALNEQAVNVAAHEFLHAVLFNTVKDSPQTAINLGNALLSELNKIDPAQVKDSNFKKRMEQYNDQTREVKMEEALTLFSDAIATGDIKFNENVFTKLGDRVRRVAQKFGVNIKFNTGRDVYNFIKDYNKSIEKGDFSLAQVKAAAGRVEGELVAPTEQQQVEQIIKESRTEEQTERNKELMQRAKEGDVLAANDLVQENSGLILRLLKFNPDIAQQSGVTSSDILQAVTDMATPGMVDLTFPGRKKSLVEEYKESDGEVTTFLGRLRQRQAEIYTAAGLDPNKFTTEQIDAPEARQVAAEEVAVTETPTKPEAKAIDPFRIMPDVKETAAAEVQKNITDKGVDVTEVTYKELKDVAPYQTVADFFNIPVSRIKNPKDNLRKSDDVANIQRWILKNEPTLKNLFTEANREVVEIKEGNRVIRKGGEPTAIPRNLLNKFYNKGARVGNNFQWTLKPYDRTTFLEAVGIKDGKVDPNFTPRAAEAQTIKGILDMYTRNLGNVAARDIIEGREDIAPAEKARAKAEVAKGKPRLMFSKQRPKRFEVSGKNGIVIMRDNAEQFEKANKIDIEFEGETINVKNLDAKNPKHRAYVQQAVENELWKYFPIESLDGSTVVDYSSKQDRGFFFTKEEWADISNKAKENKSKWLARGNKLKFDDKAIKVAKGVKAPPKKEDYYSSEKFKTKLQDWKKGVETILQSGAKAIEANNELYLPIFAIFSTQSQSSSHLARNMSVERGASKDFINATKGTKTVKEHVEPSNEMTPLMYEAMLYNEVDVLMPVIEKVYYQLGITKLQDDKTLDPSGIYGEPYNYKTTQTNEFNEGLREYFKTGDVSKIISPLIRYFNPQVNNNTSGDGIPGFNSNELILEGKTVAEIYTKQLNKQEQNPDNLLKQNELTYQVLSGKITQQEAVNILDEFIKLKSIPKATVNNNNENNTIKFSKQVPNKEVLDNLGNADAAMANARNANAPVKKIRVFDFDDTLAKSNSQVLYELPDGTTGKLNATQFAQRSGELQEQGAEFDFSEFSKVVDGKKGPVFKAIENIVKARGAEDVFILTARPADAAGPIKEFMDALGVNLPIKNIVGLGDGTAEAKARWMTGKAAEGYNDFFFVDDAYKNVKAVQDALDVFDVKSKTQQAKVKFSKEADLDKGFNDIIEQTTGIASEKEYKRVKAEVAGTAKGRVFRGIPYSAQDLVGLLYETLGKGKLGDAQMAWWKTHLLNPYARAMNDIDNSRLAMMQDYRALKKQLGLVPKNLRKKVPGEPFTREQAVRVYIWNKQGMEVPGISKSDLKDLTDFVENDAELQVFADQLINIQKGDQYAKPKEGWPAGSITTDLLENINTVKRAKYLEQWKANKDIIFSEKNLNKLEAAYGKKYRKAMENMLQRMETGRNRSFSDDSLTGRFTDWLQGSVGAIMFFNTRSALLQTISAINFVNFTDNNPLGAAKAFANQKQYWSDFTKLINSDFLKARRSGLRMNVNEADIADMAKKGGPRAVINKLLQLGFAPTQIADSFAIASGGATFYRNRVKTYTKQGLSQAEAETKAFEDFRENAEESQQSARPDRISMQQAGGLGRLILAFQNTPSQYARIIDKSIRDLKNGRGDAKTNISKIIYYSTVQNLLFNAIQQALFAFAFDDEEPEDEDKKEKYFDIANGMSDSLLRGTGLAGGVLSVTKNAIIRIVEESEKPRPKFEKVGADLLKIAPPVSSKLSKINQAARSYQWDKEEMKEKGWSLDNPAYLAAANVISATTNIPVDRGIKKINNVVGATDSDLETWERLALLGGWQDWEIGIDKENKTNKPQPRKTNKGKRKRETRKTERR